jgi:hypothetical protein
LPRSRDAQAQKQNCTRRKGGTATKLATGDLQISPGIVEPSYDISIARRFLIDAGIAEAEAGSSLRIFGSGTARQYALNAE